jgi:hypothetical protein
MSCNHDIAENLLKVIINTNRPNQTIIETMSYNVLMYCVLVYRSETTESLRLHREVDILERHLG